jgi:hypothetical protein
MPTDAASMSKVRWHVGSLGKEITLGVRRDCFVGAFRAAVFARENPFRIGNHSSSLGTQPPVVYPATLEPAA